MQSERLEPFSDNWTYLKAELAWLDRVLLLAIARQRRETQAVERVARTQADRVTSHWWKGIVFLEGGAGYDDCQKPPNREGAVKVGYQQQIHQRIQATRQQGISLALPTLCDRLKLSTFEKNMVLLSLAPEVNRRYARLYQYLQSENASDYRDAIRSSAPAPRLTSDLPTVDLALRILCRNDSEWRAARTALTSTSGLVRHSLLKLVASQEETLLAHRLQLSEPLVNYLLADKPDSKLLDRLLTGQAHKSSLSAYLHQGIPQATWADLILPPDLLANLQHLSHRVQWQERVDQDWQFQSAQPGTIAAFVGPTGTGKTSAAAAIAHSLESPLTWVDLAVIPPTEQVPLLQLLSERSPQVLLLKSAQYGFGRSTSAPASVLGQFLHRRQQQPGLTLLSCPPTQPPAVLWHSYLQAILRFPLPNPAARLRHWQQAFPDRTPLAADINWDKLAREHPFSGGVIRAIARDATFTAAATTQIVDMAHILQALTRALQSGKARPV